MAQDSLLPATIKPMAARLKRRPFDSPDHIFELKWDGFRALAFVEGGELRLQSRNLLNITSRFPEVTSLPDFVKADNTVLDGELVCFDEEGHPSFVRMQQRFQAQAGGSAAPDPPAYYVAFDLLYLDGESVMEEPLANRKELLSNVMEPGGVAQVCEFIEAEGQAFFDATCEHGLEGIMAKDKSSAYFPGKRSPGWRKVKRVRGSDFVIGGYDFTGEHKNEFTSLLLGLYNEDGRLVFVGQVGSGFSQKEAREIYGAVRSIHAADSPFESPPKLQRLSYWCRPELVCRVEYGEFTEGGRLRYPVFSTLVEDKPPDDCRIVDAPGWPRALPVG